MGEQDARRLAARYLPQVARSVLVADRQRGLMLIGQAAYHASQVSEAVSRRHLQAAVLRALLASGDAALWQGAVRQSLEFGDAIFWTFDWFGHTLLELSKDDATAPVRLLETIDWAEQLMRA